MSLPVVTFVRENLRRPDPVALGMVGVVLVYAGFQIGMSLSGGLRDAGFARFHLQDWPFPVWAAFQPMASMYNFENRWEVVVEAPGPRAAEDWCAPPQVQGGYVQHHLLNRVVLSRSWFAQCAARSHVTFESRFQGAVHQSAWDVRSGPDGLVIEAAP